MNSGGKSNLGSKSDVIFTKQITNVGSYFHKGKVVVTSGIAELTQPLDVVGPKVVGNNLVFYYRNDTGDARTLILTGL